MISDYFSISLGNLSERKFRTFLTLLGIFVGVAAFVALFGLGGALRNAVLSQFGFLSTDVISVQAAGVSGGGPPGFGAVNPLQKDYISELDSIAGVDNAMGRIIRSVTLEFNDFASTEFAASIPEGDKRKPFEEIQNLEIERGRDLEDGDWSRGVLGHNFVDGISNGYEEDIEVGTKILINGENFEVIGIFEKKGSFIIDNIIVMNEERMRDLLDVKDEYDAIAVRVTDRDEIDLVKERIERYLRKERDVKESEEDFSVSTPESSLGTVNSILTGIQIFVSMIAIISVIVGAIGIINTMFTAVLERKKEIGIMKAVGATNKNIFLIFTIESGIIGLIGGIVGIFFGSIIAYFSTFSINQFLGSTAQPEIDVMLMVILLVGSFLLGCGAGTLPALRAAKLEPVEAMRQ